MGRQSTCLGGQWLPPIQNKWLVLVRLRVQQSIKKFFKVVLGNVRGDLSSQSGADGFGGFESIFDTSGILERISNSKGTVTTVTVSSGITT